jgi:microcystin-dependent protein
MNSQAIVDDAGGGQAHKNVMPFICINFIIALQGVFPSRS